MKTRYLAKNQPIFFGENNKLIFFWDSIIYCFSTSFDNSYFGGIEVSIFFKNV